MNLFNTARSIKNLSKEKKGNKSLGRSGESAAVTFLQKQGYRIIAKNYTTRLGEIDIIARDKGILCFIEVKTRSGSSHGFPLEAVSKDKQRKLAQVALCYVDQKNLSDQNMRFDCVAVSFSKEGEMVIELIKDAFECTDN